MTLADWVTLVGFAIIAIIFIVIVLWLNLAKCNKNLPPVERNPGDW